ncbi:Uncharacterized protein Fot_26476 [Forsythia ovata]|uniref:Uncharacterized protein n=1 Tax=Forsythia ovata TaxID=205694 RepID=A0ABD1UC08_9LAMI
MEENGMEKVQGLLSLLQSSGTADRSLDEDFEKMGLILNEDYARQWWNCRATRHPFDTTLLVDCCHQYRYTHWLRLKLHARILEEFFLSSSFSIFREVAIRFQKAQKIIALESPLKKLHSDS